MAGPVELCRRPKKMVYDDFVRVLDDQTTRDLVAATSTPRQSAPVAVEGASPIISEQPGRIALPQSVPIGQMTAGAPARRPPIASQSSSTGSRHARGMSSSDVLSWSHLSEEEYGSLTGVSLMRHMDRLEREDRVFKRSLRRKLPRRRTTSSVPPLADSNTGLANGSTTYDEDDDGTESEADTSTPHWGIASESDATRPRFDQRHSLDTLVRSTNSLEDTLFTSRPPRNRRSGSVTSLPSPRMQGAGTATRGPARRQLRDEDIVEHDDEDGWLGQFDAVQDLEGGSVKTKLVVVEVRTLWQELWRSQY